MAAASFFGLTVLYSARARHCLSWWLSRRGLVLLGRWPVEFNGIPNGLPKCQKCKTGDLVPLSDFGSQGAAIHFKAWACTNPTCGFNLKIRNGDLYVDEPISSGASHVPRARN